MGREDAIPELREDVLDRDPLEQFRTWFREARACGVALPEAMTLATATLGGIPAARTVLLKGVDGEGFAIFTNYESRKGRELAENPRAALVFYWQAVGRQVRVEGLIEVIPRAESEAYFRTRPLPSRIAAWASPQSKVLESRAQLESRVAELAARYGEGDVPLPEFWGGYRVAPETIEFWQHRENRLHDRFRYRRGPAGDWRVERLAP